MNQRPTLLKPVGPASLADEEDFSVGDILVRPSLREIEANSVRETLEPRVMQVLVALARASGAVLSRDELIRQCWGGRIVGEDAINRCISKVRQLSELTDSKAFESIPSHASAIGFGSCSGQRSCPLRPLLRPLSPSAAALRLP